jgi:hypothetical protein
MTIEHFAFLSDTRVNMENIAQKPASDLERIQQSYTTGTQEYKPANEKDEPPARRQEAQTASTRGRIGSLASQV